MSETNKKVPRVRFPGFEDEWEQRKFSEFAQRESTSWTSSSDYPSVEYEDVVAGEGRLNKDVRQKETHKNGIVFDGTQVLYGKLRPYLHNWLNPDFAGVAVGDWWVLRPVGVDKKFLYCLIQTQQFDEVANQSSGSKMPRADWNLVSNKEFMIPSSADEQRQIAETFDSLDNFITLHQRELFNLETQKKAVMKKIFSQEVRFKRADGTDFPEWEEKMLGGYCDIVTGKLDANAMVEDGEYDFYTSGIATYKIDVAAFEGPAITIAGNGATVGYMHLADGKFNAYQRTYVLSQFRALREYLFYAIGDRLPLKIRKEARAGNIPYIVMDMLTDLYVPLPCEEEQRLIADFLSDFDEAIAAAKKELELWKELKKGLLQQMFV